MRIFPIMQAYKRRKAPQTQRRVRLETVDFVEYFVAGQDLNLRPSGYEPDKSGGFLRFLFIGAMMALWPIYFERWSYELRCKEITQRLLLLDWASLRHRKHHGT